MINSFLDFINILESGPTPRTNKFSIAWQIVRTNAKDQKDPDKKIQYVLDFLTQNPSRENYDRVLNWVKMTGVAYKDGIRKKFEDTTAKLINTKDEYQGTDNENDLSKISTAELTKVYNDLKKRKYGFQFKSVPKDHVEFMKALEDELTKRR